MVGTTPQKTERTMTLPIGAVLALTVILLVGACETMQPTEGASPPANLIEEEPDDGGSSEGGRDY
jgi:hypothetical protein